MTVAPIRTDLLALEHRLDLIERGIERLRLDHQKLTTQFKPLAQTTERTDPMRTRGKPHAVRHARKADRYGT